MSNDCDVVIVGAGPAGTTVADALTARGKTVVVLDKGPNRFVALEPPFALLGHLSNDEIKFARRWFLGPDPLLEPRTFRHSPDDGDRIHVGEVNNLPCGVGGGGFHADAKLPRFREVDFRALSEFGPIDGADVVDWPLTYDDLEPFYDEAEYLLGVAGDAEGNPFAARRRRPYPMPPGPDMYGAVLSTSAARELGLHPYRAPTGVNSEPYGGRPACNNCGFCGYYGCPIDAKGDPIAPLRRALESGRCEVRPDAYTTEIVLDGTGGRTTGVRYIDTATGATREVRAATVVLAAGAFETPRLMLRSGVGNSSGLVGRFLMYHFQTFVIGSFDHRLHGHRGRSVTHLHDDHLLVDDASRAYAREHDLPYFRGGIVEHGGAGGPIMESIHLPSGALHSDLMTQSTMRDRLWVFTMQGEDLPQATNTVDLDPAVRDVHGAAAGRVTYSPHRHELVASRYAAPTLEAVMRRAGAQFTVVATSPPIPGTPGDPRDPTPQSRHVMGTARMGADPQRSVFDPHSRSWDVENLFCADASVFPTSTGYGPTLTLVALALRMAGQIT